MERFDVAIVGAGPAGSTAAYRLARAHARVLLMDKVRFPRDKPCGGGLTMRAVRQLPFSGRAGRRGQDHAHALPAALRARRSSAKSPPVLCLMTQRRLLDAFLVEQAVAAGAEFRDGVHVEVESDTELRVDGEAVEVGAMIGADGANGITARSLGLGGAIVNGVALEGNLPVRASFPRTLARDARPRARRRARRLRLDLSEGRPRQRRRRRLGSTKARNCGVTFSVLCDHYGFELRRARRISAGIACPCGGRATVLARGRALVIGDAAGAIDPVSGDGIYEALVTARLAAEHTLALLDGETETLEPYQTAVQPGARSARLRRLGREGRARPLPARGFHAHAPPGHVASCSRSSCSVRSPIPGRPAAPVGRAMQVIEGLVPPGPQSPHRSGLKRP